MASYLQISRPTMYKFIESYDSGDKKEVNTSVVKLFDYIESNPLIGKRNVINYILTRMTETKDVDSEDVNEVMVTIKKYVSLNPNSEKTQFLKKCTEQSQYDLIIHYLIEITPLFKKKKLSDEEKVKLEPYKKIIEIYSEANKEAK